MSLDNFLTGASGIATNYVLPLAQIISGKNNGDGSNRSGTVDNAIKYGNLNGSGPNDPAQAKKAPASFLDFIFGTQTGSAVQANTPAPGPRISPLLLLLLAAAAAWWFFHKR